MLCMPDHKKPISKTYHGQHTDTLSQHTYTHTAGSETQNIVKTGHTLLSQVCTCIYSLREHWLFGELRTWHFDKRVILQALQGCVL